jgi:hypothetical protein
MTRRHNPNQVVSNADLHLLQSRTEEAIRLARKRAQRHAYRTILSQLACLCLCAQKRDRTRRRRARRLARDGRLSSIAHVNAGAWQGVPRTRTLFEAIYLTGLRKAGMPEE